MRRLPFLVPLALLCVHCSSSEADSKDDENLGGAANSPDSELNASGGSPSSDVMAVHYSARKYHPVNGELRQCTDVLANADADVVESTREASFVQGDMETVCLTTYEFSEEPCPVTDDLLYACVFTRPELMMYGRVDVYIYGENMCTTDGQETMPWEPGILSFIIDGCDNSFGRVGATGDEIRSGEVVIPPAEDWFR